MLLLPITTARYDTPPNRVNSESEGGQLPENASSESYPLESSDTQYDIYAHRNRWYRQLTMLSTLIRINRPLDVQVHIEESYRRSLQQSAKSAPLNRFLLFLLAHLLPAASDEQLQTSWEQLLSVAAEICNENKDIPVASADASSFSGHADDDVASPDQHINELQKLLLA